MSDSAIILLLILAVLIIGAGPVGIFLGVIAGLALLLWVLSKCMDFFDRRAAKRRKAG